MLNLSATEHGRQESIFDALPRFYTWFREWAFADHTDTLVHVIERTGCGVSQGVFVEVGCGPGFYARAIARLMPDWTAIGVDSSKALLQIAQLKAKQEELSNCVFLAQDVVGSDHELPAANVILASRLFLVLESREAAIRAFWRELKPGGSLLICEPFPGIRTSIPLLCMEAATFLTGQNQRTRHCRQKALTHDDLSNLTKAAEWGAVTLWQDSRYQYALCQK